jgi:hypothetical protein
MTGLRSALERYMNLRQGLGYKYQHQAWRLAVSFMKKRRATTHEAGRDLGDIATRSARILGVAAD